jgi:DNA-directed RNA polymerase specialized sigma24 family protein
MNAVGPMDDEGEPNAHVRPGAAGPLIEEHAAVLGRVAMALVGDAARAERALEQVAREAGSRAAPAGLAPLVWLLGLVRAASVTQLSKLPLRTSRGDEPPATERLGAADAVPARASLAALKPTEREAVVLAIVGGLDAAGVAAACNVEVATARARIARGLEQLVVRAEEGGER